MTDVDFLDSRFNNKVNRIVSMSRDAVTMWDPINGICSFQPLQILPGLFHRNDIEGIPVIFIALNLPRKMLHFGILNSLLILTDH